MATNHFTEEPSPSQAEPQLLMPDCASMAVESRSVCRLDGSLARRRLLTPFHLPSWTSAEILTNSVVQLVVDAAGKPISLALLHPGSGSAEADRLAMDLARTARFAATNQTPSSNSFTWGMLIFEWKTTPK